MNTRRVIRGMLIRDFLDPRELSLDVYEGIYIYEAGEKQYLEDIYNDSWTYRIRREPSLTNEGPPGLVEVFTKAIDLSDVFSTSDANAATYVDRAFAETTYGVVLTLALNDPGKVVLLHGPSKLGKTALWRSTIVDPIEVHCNQQTTLTELYQDILGQLQSTNLTKITSETTDERQRSVELTGNLGLYESAEFVLAASGSNTQANSISEEKIVTPLAVNARTVAVQLRSAKKVLLIENYHRMSLQTFESLCIDLRVFMDQRVTIVFVGIPEDPFRIIGNNQELEGRVNFLDFAFWERKDLQQIALNGAEILNIEIEYETLDFLASEAAGSPLLMQEYCWLLCVANKIGRDQNNKTSVSLTSMQFKTAFNTIESTKFSHFNRIHKQLEQLTSEIDGFPTDFVSTLVNVLRKTPTLAVSLDVFDGLGVSDTHYSQLITALNSIKLTEDLFALDPDKRVLSICRPLYLPFIRWII
jgi:Holliday junction resolvasome RuvABC ATP-dependent DNA helicase subunit